MCQACVALSDLSCPSSSLSPAAADSFSSSILTSSATVQDSVCPLSSASSVSQDNRGGDRCKPLNSQTVLFSWNTHSNPEMFKLSSADLSHAAVVNRFWLFGGNERSLRFIERCIRSFPNFCLLGLEGTPVSWSLMDQTGEMRMAGTLPEYRAQGSQNRLCPSIYQRRASQLPLWPSQEAKIQNTDNQRHKAMT